jgi:mannose-6-phosphate isomerase-like protein (cupin superfamily)
MSEIRSNVTFVKKLTQIKPTRQNHEVVYEFFTSKDGLPLGIAVVDEEHSNLHFHRKTLEWYFILEGSAEIVLCKRKMMLKKNSLVFIPPSTPHKIRRVGKRNLRILVISCPPWSKNDHFLID